MKRSTLLIAWVFVVFSAGQVLASGSEDCFRCHDKSKFPGSIVHQPFAKGQCDLCHSPHAARHEKLLLKSQETLCYGCHAATKAKIEKQKVLHPPVKQGKCSACHSPHAASYPGLMAKKGSEQCFGCHEESRKKYAVVHAPFQKGDCGACHAAHGGDDYRMVKKDGNALCLDCHTSTEGMSRAHLGKTAQGLDCLSCHNPHGGAKRSLLREFVHKPFAEGNCKACHGKGGGAAVCLECHKETLTTFSRPHSHLGFSGSGNPCVSCHNPHVGDRPGLMMSNEGQVCQACHADTFARRDKMLHKHPGWNRCTDCHEVHGSEHAAMLKKGPAKVCESCHEKHSGFTHPIGDKALDPRDGQPMDCLTCHDANTGSMFENFLHGSAEKGLCIQCHKTY